MVEKESELKRHSGDRSPEEIRREIGETRERLDSTVSALEERLNPSQLVDKGWDWLQHSENSKAILGFVRRHPLPLAVLGIGAGWLAIAAARSRRDADVDIQEDRSEEILASTREVDALGENDWAGGNGEPPGRLRRMGRSAAAGVRVTGRKVRESVDVHPLAAGAIAFAAGVAGGLSLPPSRVENRLMGRTSDRVVEQTKEAGIEAARRAKDEAKRAAQKTTDAAKSAIREATDKVLP